MNRALIDSDPSWIQSVTGRPGVGISFQCPVHPGGGCYQGVFFKNPFDGGEVIAGHKCYWTRIGDDFATLTLTPSIKVSNPDGTVHWHGFLTNGQLSCL